MDGRTEEEEIKIGRWQVGWKMDGTGDDETDSKSAFLIKWKKTSPVRPETDGL